VDTAWDLMTRGMFCHSTPMWVLLTVLVSARDVTSGGTGGTKLLLERLAHQAKVDEDKGLNMRTGEDEEEEQLMAKVGADGRIMVNTASSPIASSLLQRRALTKLAAEDEAREEDEDMEQMGATWWGRRRRRRTPYPTMPPGVLTEAKASANQMMQSADTGFSQTEVQVENAGMEGEKMVAMLDNSLENIEILREKVADSVENTADKETQLVETTAEEAMAVDEGFTEESENLQTKPTSVLGGEINSAKKDLALAASENSNLIADEMDEGIDDLNGESRDAEKEIEDTEDTLKDDMKGEMGETDDDFDMMAEGVQEKISDMKAMDHEEDLKRTEKEFSVLQKDVSKKVADSLRYTDKKISQTTGKEFRKADKSAGKVIDQAVKTMTSNEKKTVNRQYKEIGKFSNKAEKKFQDIEKGEAKVIGSVGKEIERQMATDSVQFSGVMNVMDGVKEIMGEITNEGKAATDQVERTNRALPSLIKGAEGTFIEQHKELKDEVNEAIVVSEEKTKQVLDQSYSDSVVKIRNQLSKTKASMSTDAEELTKRQQSTAIKMRDDAGEVMSLARASTQLQDTAEEEVNAGDSVAKDAAGQVQYMEKKLATDYSTGADFEKNTLKEFRQNVKKDMTVTGTNLQKYVGATGGENSIPARVATGLQDLTVKTSSDLQTLGKDMGTMVQDVEMPMQDAEHALLARVGKLGAAMGVGGEGASTYAAITSGFPTEMNRIQDVSSQRMERMEKLDERIDKELAQSEDAIGGNNGVISSVSKREQASIQDAVNQLTQATSDDLTKSSFSVMNAFDKTKRALAEDTERSKFQQDDLVAGDVDERKKLDGLTHYIEKLYAQENTMEKEARDSPATLGAVAGLNQEVKNEMDQIVEHFKMLDASVSGEAREKGMAAVAALSAALQKQSNAGKAYVKTGVQSFVSGLEKGVDSTKESTQNAGKELQLDQKRLVKIGEMLDQDNKDLHSNAQATIGLADKAVSFSRKGFGELQVEAMNKVNLVQNKMGSLMQAAGLTSRRGEEAILWKWGEDADGLAAQTAHALSEGRNRISSVEASVMDHTAAASRSRKSASGAVESGGKKWGSAQENEKADLERKETQEEYAREAEQGEFTGLKNQGSGTDRRAAQSMDTLGSITEDFGAKSADDISMKGDAIENAAKIAKTNSQSVIMGLEAQERMAAEQQDQRDHQLAGAVGSRMAEIDDAVGAAGKGFNLTEAQMGELKELLKVEQLSIGDNSQYLKSYVGQSAASVLGLLGLVTKQMMKQAHADFSEAEQHGFSLDAFTKLLEGAKGGEGYKTLEKIAGADELAIQTGGMNEEMDYWLEMFEKESVQWRKGVDVAFEDAGALQSVEAQQAAADKKEMEANQARMAARLESKMGGMINGEGADLSDMDKALDGDVSTLKMLGASRNAADKTTMDGLQAELQSGSARASHDVKTAGKTIADVQAANEEAHHSLGKMDQMLLAIQKQNEERLAAEKKRLDTRAREFDNALFMGDEAEQAEPEDIQGLREDAKNLQATHSLLQTRHEKADKTLESLLGKIEGLHTSVV